MRRTLRIVGGVVAGYVTVVLLATGTTAVLRALLEVARSEDPPAAYLLFDLGYSLAYSLVGGWIAAKLGAALLSSRVLAAVFLLLGAWSAIAGLDATHPGWYQWAAALLGPAAVLIGGRLAGERRGLPPRPRT